MVGLPGRALRPGALALLPLLLPAPACGHNKLYAAPTDAASQPSWLAQLRAERAAIRKDINYTGDVYLDSAVNWTRLSYVQPQTHLYDRYLYDPVAHAYTVDRYLDDVEQRYGGIDSILLWPTYTNIGIDARNQWDYFRALPGGLEGLRQLTAQFKARGVRVLWAYNPWDQGTRDEGEPHWATLARLLKETGGDGFNGDTMSTMYKQFWDAGVSSGYRFVGEMEGGGYPAEGQRPEDASWASAGWSPMGWGYFNHGLIEDNITYAFLAAPGVDRLKWLDGRRMTHVCDRWAKNRTDALQYAFFNGVGYESWENVWGIFMHFTPRDGEALRRISTLLRWLGKEGFTQDYADWEPYTPDLHRPAGLPFSAGGPVASRFVHRTGDCVWLLVNRAAIATSAELDTSACNGTPRLLKAPRRLHDLYHGTALPSGSSVRLDMEAGGYGAVLATSRSLPPGPLMARMRELTKQPLQTYSALWEPLRQEMVHMPAPPSSPLPPRGTVLVPKTRFRFRTAGVEIEGGCDPARDTWGICCDPGKLGMPACPHDEVCKTPCAFRGDDSRGVDVQFPWEASPGRFHDRVLEVGPFFMDRHLVTKGDFARYLSAAGYRPRDEHNFLQGWRRGAAPAAASTLEPAPGEEQQPVVWVSLGEARAYCAWAGKRLPHAYEWQLAAQGTDGRLFPWGNTSEEEGLARFPRASAGPSVPKLPDAGAFSPAGDSPFGVADLVGVVWQYTDEFRDAHTRTVLLKGSSLYTPMLSADFPALTQVGNWYFPKALQLDRHNRMMLMDDSYERAATLGFRCVADHAEGAPAPHHYRDFGPAAGLDSKV